MSVNRRIRLNLRNFGNLPAVMLSQYDEGYNLVFEIFDGASAAGDLSGYTATLKGVRSDTLSYSFTGTISNNVLTFEIDTTMTGVAGKGTAEIVLTASGVVFATFNMPVFVEKAAVPDGSIDADVTRAEEVAEQIQEIVDTAAEQTTAQAEQIVADLEADVSQINEDFNDITDTTPASYAFATKERGTTTLPDGWSTTSGYLRNMNLSSPGNLTGTGSATNNTFYFLVTEDVDVYVVPNGNPSTTCIGTFSGSPYGTANRVSPVYSNKTDDYPLPTEANPLHVTAGQYLTFSFYNWGTLEGSNWVVYAIGTGSTVLKSTLPLTSEMESQVDEKIAKVSDVMVTGYYHLTGSWARGAWDNSGTTIDSRNYRIHYTEPITLNHKVTIIMDQGFLVAGYADGVFFNGATCKTLQAGVEYKIYVRRYEEDSSEIADIDTFANALNVSTALAQVELYAPTFADVSMFERVGVCGDSYAAGGGIISGIRPLTWGKNLERQAGITVDIYARSGQNVMEWNVDATNGLPALLNGAECGLYWLQHGINGTSTAEQFGSLEDITTYPHPNTFCGQYTEAIEQIKTAFPNARIIMSTIIGSSFALYQSSQYAPVNEAIRAIAEHCEVMVVDVADDDFYRSPYYSAWIRSNHPTAMQCAGIAMANRRLISKCIQENGDYFVNYGAD